MLSHTIVDIEELTGVQENPTGHPTGCGATGVQVYPAGQPITWACVLAGSIKTTANDKIVIGVAKERMYFFIIIIKLLIINF